MEIQRCVARALFVVVVLVLALALVVAPQAHAQSSASPTPVAFKDNIEALPIRNVSLGGVAVPKSTRAEKPLGCRFLLLILCYPERANLALFASDAALGAYDLHGTSGYEDDPLARPFLRLPRPATYSLLMGGDLLAAGVGERMRYSPRWYRHVWWLPQNAIAAGHTWGIQYNIRHH